MNSLVKDINKLKEKLPLLSRYKLFYRLFLVRFHIRRTRGTEEERNWDIFLRKCSSKNLSLFEELIKNIDKNENNIFKDSELIFETCEFITGKKEINFPEDLKEKACAHASSIIKKSLEDIYKREP